MKARLKLFGLFGLYWITFFVICRAIFVIYHFHQTALLHFTDIATLFLLGLRMDLAMTGYWLIIPGLLLTLPVRHFRALYYIQNFTLAALLLISVIIVVVDLELYKHWGFRMNTTPLFYFGSEAAGSVNPGVLILLIFILVLLYSSFLVFFLKKLSKRILELTPLPWLQVPAMLLITACLFIPIRSSFSVAPLNSGVVYFHKTLAFPNHAGINVVWNFFDSWLAQEEVTYPGNFYAAGNETSIVHDLVKSENPSPPLFFPSRPNVVLIILESFTSKIIEPLGGLKDITPNLNRLAKEGVLFDNFYASGDRTDKGLVSVLSGYPAQPLTSVIKFPEKTLHLPYLPRELGNLGYTTSFLYGGDIGFANMESYLTTAGFQHITEDDDFDSSLDNSKWGVSDQYVFDRLFQECDTARSPFFKVMLSLSSHEPFEVPMEPVIRGTDERSLYLNACYYTDKCLGQFLDKAKKQPWWKNTLIVITADHGHRYPDSAEEAKDKDRFQIPLLWLGGALLKKDTVIHTLGGQTDLPNTLLGQLDKSHSTFKFSKNILDKKVNPFAVYIFHNGFGYLEGAGETIYDFDYHEYIKKTGDSTNRIAGEAYMQMLFNDYNSR